jgi:hypothetical protein
VLLSAPRGSTGPRASLEMWELVPSSTGPEGQAPCSAAWLVYMEGEVVAAWTLINGDCASDPGVLACAAGDRLVIDPCGSWLDELDQNLSARQDVGAHAERPLVE